jgi:putative methylase
MKQKALEMELQKVPPHPSPSPELEQYMTPAHVAAEMLYIAFGHGDIEGKRVLDLGCGTGILTIGAALLGAKEVAGVDVDEESVRLAHRMVVERSLENVDLMVLDISEFEDKGDCVIMNPPFGCQTRHADMPFFEKALKLCPTVYSLHLTETEDHIRKMAKELNGEITFERRFTYDIKHLFDFHRKERKEFRATYFRTVRTGE